MLTIMQTFFNTLPFNKLDQYFLASAQIFDGGQTGADLTTQQVIEHQRYVFLALKMVFLVTKNASRKTGTSLIFHSPKHYRKQK